MDAVNQRGVFATIAAAISEMDCNIDNVTIEDKDGKYSTIIFLIGVKDRIHLANVMRHIRSIEMVGKISRDKG